MKLYKLTDGDGKTFGGTQWGPGVSHSGTGEGGLCGPGWIHAYEHPLIAVLMNPIHSDCKNKRMWEAEGEVGLRDGQLKCGCATLTTIREIPLPEITAEMRVRFAIMCPREASTVAAWNAWADKWLSGEDRSADAAEAAAAASTAAAWKAWSDKWLSVEDRSAAAAAADAAACAAEAAACAAAAAAAAAEAAAYRASWAAALSVQWVSLAAACCGMDLAAIAEKACAVSRK
jgi:hypothetical protein